MITVVIIMAVSGLAGGLFNFLTYLTQADPNGANPEPKPDSRLVLVQLLVGGLIAAAMVPLFLSLAQSELAKNAQTDPIQTMVFVGFCLVASVSSRTFIQTVTERALAMAREARSKANRAAGEVQNLKPRLELIEQHAEEPEEAEEELHAAMAEHGADPANEVLRSLANSQWLYRSVAGIANDIGKHPAEVEPILQAMHQAGDIAQKQSVSSGRPRWYLTLQGKQKL